MSKDIIVFEKVSKTFPNAALPAVYETDLRIKEGSFVTILGASGSGKTTLLKMINRIHEPTSGTIYVNGQDIMQTPVTDLRIQIGYVIQQIGLFPHLSVEENIATVPRILKWQPNKIQERIDYLLDLVHLPHTYKKRYPSQLSGGQQQRVGLARAMAGDPAIMLMDEPFGAIDAITRQSLQDEIILIQQKLNKTILFVTHDVQEAVKLGDQIIVMNEGAIQQFDTPLQILTKPANDFVRQLVHSDNQIHQLDLIRAENVMIPINTTAPIMDQGAFKIFKNESLKNVLLALLKQESDVIFITDEQDIPIGTISWEQLKLRD
jgi:osmoprotectant transport system ATP-binding protein